MHGPSIFIFLSLFGTAAGVFRAAAEALSNNIADEVYVEETMQLLIFATSQEGVTVQSIGLDQSALQNLQTAVRRCDKCMCWLFNSAPCEAASCCTVGHCALLHPCRSPVPLTTTAMDTCLWHAIFPLVELVVLTMMCWPSNACVPLVLVGTGCRFAKNVAITDAGNQLVAKLGEVYTEQSGKAFEDFLRAAVAALNACDGYARFESEQVRCAQQQLASPETSSPTCRRAASVAARHKSLCSSSRRCCAYLGVFCPPPSLCVCRGFITVVPTAAACGSVHGRCRQASTPCCQWIACPASWRTMRYRTSTTI